MSQLQLVSEPAQVPLCFGLDNAQLRVDVLVLICCIFLVLETHCFAVQTKAFHVVYHTGNSGCHQFKRAFNHYLNRGERNILFGQLGVRLSGS